MEAGAWEQCMPHPKTDRALIDRYITLKLVKNTQQQVPDEQFPAKIAPGSFGQKHMKIRISARRIPYGGGGSTTNTLVHHNWHKSQYDLSTGWDTLTPLPFVVM